MEFLKDKWKGILLCLILALPCWFLGKAVPVVGAPVFGILLGMAQMRFLPAREQLKGGIAFTSKKVLQYAVILLGFGLNLSVVLETGVQSLPIICSTIAISLIMAWLLRKILHVPSNLATLIGVGSSICGGSAVAATAPVIEADDGGSAVAATAPVIEADDEEVAQAISVIFLFNVIAALIFPVLGGLIGFDTTSGESFGIFAGTAVNDTSSVTATASTWDSLYGLGSQTLDKAVTVKLTRTLAIIPITLVLAIARAKREKAASNNFSFKRAFPMFILWFIVASLITTICTALGVNASVFTPLKTLSKFFIVMAMTAIGLNTDVVKLVKNGGKPIALGFGCWVSIIAVSLLMQFVTGIM